MTIFPKCLLIAALSLSAAVAAPQKTRGGTDADERQVTAFRLSMDNFNKFGNASAALMKVTQGDPSLRKQMEEEQKGKNLQEETAALERHPSVVAAIRSAGLAAREYIVMTASIISTAMVVGMKKQGMITELPPIVSAENAAFVDQNYEKISAMLKKMQDARDRDGNQ
jgi:hypothetical protein